jgi:hypothetical protein
MPVLHRLVEPTNSLGQSGTEALARLDLSLGGFQLILQSSQFVELTGNFVQISLRMHRQVGPLREVLPQQSIGVFIRTALPRTLRIAEVNVDVGR